MADVTRERTGSFLQQLFKILIDNEEPLAGKDSLAQLQSKFELTEYERGKYESGGIRFEKIVRFATVDCVKAGWMIKSNGRWSVTDAGKAALEKYPEPGQFYREAVKLYSSWKKNQPDDVIEPPDDGDNESDKEANITYEQAEELAWAEIAEYLHGVNPYEMQRLVADLVEAMGYYIAWIAPPGKDGGTDILALKDPLGTQPPRIRIQVKRQNAKVTVDGLRSFMSLLADDEVGLFVSLGGFTKDAELKPETTVVELL